MENMADNKSLSPLKIILLFALISLTIELYQFIINLLVINTGVREIRYIRLYLQVLPGIYIIHMNFWKRSLKFPHLIPFLLMISVFVLFEKYLSPFRDFYPKDYQFVWQQINIYIFFLMFVNFGLDRITFYKVINFFFYSGLLICLISFAGYLGFFRISELYEGIEVITYTSPKPSHVLHVDRAAYLYCFTFLLLIIKQLKEKAFSTVYLFRDIAVILLLFGMITVSSSRGATLIFIIFIIYYFYFLWRYGIRDIKIKVFIICVILVSTIVLFRTTNVLVNFKSSESQITLIKRFEQFRSYTVTRIENVQNSWKNFLDYPFTGVGYYNAAKRATTGTRSNNQYLQLLGSSGIIFFVIYIYYSFKFFIFRFDLLKRPEVALSFIYGASILSFARPLYVFAILGYITFYFYYNSKSIPSNSKI